jgi:hypothetical protein
MRTSRGFMAPEADPRPRSSSANLKDQEDAGTMPKAGIEDTGTVLCLGSSGTLLYMISYMISYNHDIIHDIIVFKAL